MFTIWKLSCIIFKMVLTKDIITKVIFAPGIVIIDIFSLFRTLLHKV
jgi:hypothetical protein